VRISAPTHLLEASAGLRTIQIMLGHRDLEETTIFLHLSNRQANARGRWLEARGKELLPTRLSTRFSPCLGNFAPLALQNKGEIYALLFRASA
jgi:hypothetical protein